MVYLFVFGFRITDVARLLRVGLLCEKGSECLPKGAYGCGSLAPRSSIYRLISGCGLF